MDARCSKAVIDSEVLLSRNTVFIPECVVRPYYDVWILIVIRSLYQCPFGSKTRYQYCISA